MVLWSVCELLCHSCVKSFVFDVNCVKFNIVGSFHLCCGDGLCWGLCRIIIRPAYAMRITRELPSQHTVTRARSLKKPVTNETHVHTVAHLITAHMYYRLRNTRTRFAMILATHAAPNTRTRNTLSTTTRSTTVDHHDCDELTD